MLAAAYILGWCFGGLSLAMMVPAVHALLLGERHEAMAFMNSSVGLFFLAGSIVFALYRDTLHLGRRQQLLVVISLWFLLPAGAAMPFYLSGAADTLPKAYFEAMSGFTTTGATLFGSLAPLAKSIILWRALLQWLGGLATLLSLSFIIGRFLGAELFGRDTSAIMQSSGGTSRDLENALTAIVPIYAGLTLACFVLLTLFGIPSFDALCLALSTLSTGGFMPRDGSIALYGSPAAELTLTVFMFFGAVSIVWLKALVTMNRVVLARNSEPVGIAITVLLLGLALAAVIFHKTAGSDLFALVHSLTLGLASAASLLSTTGFEFGHSEQIAIPYLVLLPIAVVGGGRYSTAGGLKFSRLATMLELSRRELRKLLYPHSVGRMLYSNRERDENVRRSVWSIFAVTLIALVAMILGLSYLDMSLEGALMAALSALSNFGPAYEMAKVGNPSAYRAFADMPTNAQLILCAGMVVGRVETLMLLGLFNMAIWRK
jgi:trk system potassium uptake protein TrkH